MNTVLKGRFFRRWDPSAARQAVDFVVRMCATDGIEMDIYTYNTLFRIFIKTGAVDLEEAYVQRLFQQDKGHRVKPDAVTFTTLISAAADRDDKERIVWLLKKASEKLSRRQKPREWFNTFAAAASAFVDLKDFKAAEETLLDLVEAIENAGAAEIYRSLHPSRFGKPESGVHPTAFGDVHPAAFGDVHPAAFDGVAKRPVQDDEGGQKAETLLCKLCDGLERAFSSRGGQLGPQARKFTEAHHDRLAHRASASKMKENELLINLHMRLFRELGDYESALQLMQMSVEAVTNKARWRSSFMPDERCWSMLVNTACNVDRCKSAKALRRPSKRPLTATFLPSFADLTMGCACAKSWRGMAFSRPL
eukprot:scaffold7096_cov253-Pinguiococcus_pyrenoidosus.AAC.6